MNPKVLDHQIKPLPCKTYLLCRVLLPRQRSWVGTPHWLHIWCLLRPCWSPWLLTKWCGEFWEHRADLSVNRDCSRTGRSIPKWAYPSESDNERAGGFLVVGTLYYTKTFCKKQHTLASTTSLRFLMPFPSLLHCCLEEDLYFSRKSVSSTCISEEDICAGRNLDLGNCDVMWYSSL